MMLYFNKNCLLIINNNLQNMSYFLTDFLNHLGVVELCCLKLTCKQFNETISQDSINKLIIINIKTRLKNYVDDYEEFQQFLMKTNAFISGSFIIQSILDQHYKDSDLDIYVPFAYKRNKIINFKNFTITKQSGSYRNEDASDIKIYHVTDYQCNNKKMQLIYVKINSDRQSIINYLTEYFDLDICKNFYRLNDLYIHNLSQIVSQKLYFNIRNTSWNPIKSIERVNKYQNRGFEIIKCYSLQELTGEKIIIHHVEHIKYHLYRMIEGDKSLLTGVSKYIRPSTIYISECRKCYFGSISCEDCSKFSKIAKKEFLLFNSLKDGKVIYLSDDNRNTNIDHYVDFYYPKKNTHILWHDDQYYLFVTV